MTVTDGTWTLTVEGDYNVYTLGAAILKIHEDITSVSVTT